MIEVVTYSSLVYAVADTLRNAITDLMVQPYDQITEGIPQTPLLQVYPDNANVDDVGSNDRASFGAQIRRTHFVVFADGFARPRSHLGEDLKAQMEMIERFDARLIEQTDAPLFGLPAIQSFHWKWQRATFPIGEGPSRIEYAGCRFTIDLWVW